MLLLGLLFFLARSAGFPTSPAPSVPTTHRIIRRAPWDILNPLTGLCDCPNTRSVEQIVWTCAATLILAAWVSVHLNVPPKGASPFRLMVLRVGAVFATILGPEIILKWAATEWYQARWLQKRMAEKHPTRTWTMSHSFYAVMGGFAGYDKEVKTHRPVHPEILIPRLEEHHFPMISEDDIKDKSKGDGLIMTIAVLQFLWFSVQFIGRLAKGWAATELEVLTFATCIMIMAIYCLWWDKPLDVRSQTLLAPIQNVADDAAADDADGPMKQEGPREDPPAIGFFKRIFTSNPTPRERFHRQVFEHKFSWKRLFSIVAFPFLILREAFKVDEFWGPDCARPTAAASFYGAGDGLPTLLMCISATVLGGMHFITWSFSMPTVVELWMWRAASIALTSLGILATLRNLADDFFDDQAQLYPLLTKTLHFLIIGFSILYPLIRLAIVVDALVLLRDLPDTAFLIFSWADFIPSL